MLCELRTLSWILFLLSRLPYTHVLCFEQFHNLLWGHVYICMCLQGRAAECGVRGCLLIHLHLFTVQNFWDFERHAGITLPACRRVQFSYYCTCQKKKKLHSWGQSKEPKRKKKEKNSTQLYRGLIQERACRLLVWDSKQVFPIWQPWWLVGHSPLAEQCTSDKCLKEPWDWPSDWPCSSLGTTCLTSSSVSTGNGFWGMLLLQHVTLKTTQYQKRMYLWVPL